MNFSFTGTSLHTGKLIEGKSILKFDDPASGKSRYYMPETGTVINALFNSAGEIKSIFTEDDIPFCYEVVDVRIHFSDLDKD